MSEGILSWGWFRSYLMYMSHDRKDLDIKQPVQVGLNPSTLMKQHVKMQQQMMMMMTIIHQLRPGEEKPGNENVRPWFAPTVLL